MSRNDMTDDELAAWKAKKDAGRARAHAAEMETAVFLRDHPHAIDGFRVFCARMNPYSIRNCMRIHGQNPDAAHVEPRKFWGWHGRAVADQGAPIWIIAPKVERTFTKEVENVRTGETEKVEDSYKVWPVEDVYPAQATAPKNGPCLFCHAAEGEWCPDWCPVMQPQAGVAPTRDEVAEALNAVLKDVGGFDPSLLGELGPDPLPDDGGCDGVVWQNLTITPTTESPNGRPGRSGAKGSGRKPPRKRRHRYTYVIDLERPGVRFGLAGFGVVWISPYELRNDTDGNAAITIQYGDDVTAEHRWDSRHHHAGPHAPTINGITFTGTSIVYPHEENWRWFSPHREGGGTVTERAAEKMGQVVRQLLDHYRGLVELDAVEEAGFRKRAARRAREADHEAARLADREQELAAEREAAQQRAAELRHQAANPNEL